MKKQLLIISISVVIVSILVSCSVGCRDGACSIRYNSTAAVTDSKGTTLYYEPVIDDKGNVSTTDKNHGVFVEIETQSNGKAVTEKNGTYVTNEHTTVLPIDRVTDNSSTTTDGANSIPTTNDVEDADNVVEFEPIETTKEDTNTTDGASPIPTATETTTKKEIQPATDKDGWVTKWY